MADWTQREQALIDIWEEHLRHEFDTCDPDAVIDTMGEDAHVNHVPVMTGGWGKPELYRFYTTHFIGKTPRDGDMIPVSRTVGEDRLVDEFVFSFTHDSRMDYMLPGVEPTGRRVEIPVVVVVEFKDGKLAGERLYWDQASVLVQIGLLNRDGLPVTGVESTRKVLDPRRASNALIHQPRAGG